MDDQPFSGPNKSAAPAGKSTHKKTALAAPTDDPFGILASFGITPGDASLWFGGGAICGPGGSNAFGSAAFGSAAFSSAGSGFAATFAELSAAGPADGAAAEAAGAGIEAAAARCYDDEVCAQCGAQMCRGANDIEYVCVDCGCVVEGDTAEPEDDAPRAAPNAARLRIVGPNSNQLQPDLYRSGAGNTAVTQKKQIYEEYCAYRALFIEAGGRAFPLDACNLASDFYNAVQVQCVKRSQNKKAIMAACLQLACITREFSPKPAELAAFMQLPNKGIARGLNFVRSLVADGKMDVDLDVDPCQPEITTLFAHLGFENKCYDGLRRAVHDVVQTAINNSIGTNSILRSKVAGATFVVLRRCRDRELVPRAVSMQEFCQDHIRKNTIERFTRQLENYHSYFEPCYARAGLDTSLSR